MSIEQGITPPLMASAPIFVSSIVTMDPNNPYCVIQATGPNVLPIGIAQQGSYGAPGVFAGANTLATNPTVPPTGTAPNNILIYGESSVCRLQLSPSCGAIIPGQLLTCDPQGFGIDLTNPLLSGIELNYACAVALTKGSASQFIRVLVVAPYGLSSGPTRIRVSLTPGVVGAGSAQDQTFTVAGLTGSTQAAVVVSAESLTANIGIVNARILSQGSLQIRFINPTQASIVPGVSFFDIGVIA